MSSKEKLSIHVVDDEPVIAWTIAAILESEGFAALSFTNPHKSLEAAAVAAPDLLISDVAMPQMNGVELAILVRVLCPKCKVLLFSGRATTADLLSQAAARGHLFWILKKPIHPSELLSAVRSLTMGDTISSCLQG